MYPKVCSFYCTFIMVNGLRINLKLGCFLMSAWLNRTKKRSLQNKYISYFLNTLKLSAAISVSFKFAVFSFILSTNKANYVISFISFIWNAWQDEYNIIHTFRDVTIYSICAKHIYCIYWFSLTSRYFWLVTKGIYQ